mgnify:CR=1 FL=1
MFKGEYILTFSKSSSSCWTHRAHSSIPLAKCALRATPINFVVHCSLSLSVSLSLSLSLSISISLSLSLSLSLSSPFTPLLCNFFQLSTLFLFCFFNDFNHRLQFSCIDIVIYLFSSSSAALPSCPHLGDRAGDVWAPSYSRDERAEGVELRRCGSAPHSLLSPFSLLHSNLNLKNKNIQYISIFFCRLISCNSLHEHNAIQASKQSRNALPATSHCTSHSLSAYFPRYIDLQLSLSLSLSVSIDPHLFVSTSKFLYQNLSIYSSISPSAYLSISFHLALFLSLSICQSIDLYLYIYIYIFHTSISIYKSVDLNM